MLLAVPLCLPEDYRIEECALALRQSCLQMDVVRTINMELASTGSLASTDNVKKANCSLFFHQNFNVSVVMLALVVVLAPMLPPAARSAS